MLPAGLFLIIISVVFIAFGFLQEITEQDLSIQSAVYLHTRVCGYFPILLISKRLSPNTPPFLLLVGNFYIVNQSVM